MAVAVEEVFDATVEETKRHPYLVVGGLIAAVIVVWVLASGHGGGKPASQPFTFSYGPSDAQVKAGTELAIAQAGNQTAVTLENIHAGTQTAVAQDYFGYLATNSANQLAATVSGQKYANATAMSGNATQAQIAGIQASTAQFQTAQNDATAKALAQIQSTTSITTAGYAMLTAHDQISANERIQGNLNTLNAQVAAAQIQENYNVAALQSQAAAQSASQQNQVYAAALLAQNRGPWA